MKKHKKAPHHDRLSALDLALFNEANAHLEAARQYFKVRALECRVHELEHDNRMRQARDAAHAAQGMLEQAQAQHRTLAARLSQDYAVDLKNAAIVPETGQITTNTQD